MSNLNIIQRKRVDGSMVLVGKSYDAADPDRAFPEEYEFSFRRIYEGAWPATVDGDKVTLEYENAKAVYKVVDRTNDVLKAELESSELFDAPDVVAPEEDDE